MKHQRYSRQVLFPEIGEAGQRRILDASVLVVGCGALGTVSSNYLARAGVGRIRILDRDYVELDNLQRQVLYDEEDAANGIPKAVAASKALARINSEILVEPVVADAGPGNIEALMDGMNLVIDGTDNIETRYLINDACVKHDVPWIYGGAVGSEGMTMNILPGRSACFRCLMKDPPRTGSLATCDTAGVLGPAPGVIASIQAAQALKFLAGFLLQGDVLTYVDLWEGRFDQMSLKRQEQCPTCQKKDFEFLEGRAFSEAFSICGRNAVQISPPSDTKIDMARMKKQLQRLGEVSDNGFFLQFKTGAHEIIIFPDGRAMIKGTTDEAVARSLLSKYVGM